MKQHHKAAVAAVATVMTTMLLAAAGWACVAGPTAFTSTMNVKAGDQVGVEAVQFNDKKNPVLVRFNALDGPVLADLGAPAGENGKVAGSVTIPPGTEAGNYVLVFTQAGPDGELVQTPIRSLVTVVGDAGSAPVVGADLSAADTARTPALVTDDASYGVGTVALMALGFAGVGLLLAGGAALYAGRRSSSLRAERVDA